MATDKTLTDEIDRLSAEIGQNPEDYALYLRRGKLYHQSGAFDKALNDYTQVLRLDPGNTEAEEYSLLLKEIFAYRYTDLYNP